MVSDCIEGLFKICLTGQYQKLYQMYYTIPILNWCAVSYHTNTQYASSSHTILHTDTVIGWYQYKVRTEMVNLDLD